MRNIGKTSDQRVMVSCLQIVLYTIAGKKQYFSGLYTGRGKLTGECGDGEASHSGAYEFLASLQECNKFFWFNYFYS